MAWLPFQKGTIQNDLKNERWKSRGKNADLNNSKKRSSNVDKRFFFEVQKTACQILSKKYYILYQKTSSRPPNWMKSVSEFPQDPRHQLVKTSSESVPY